ncbi:hypothetical protein LEMLEM_LOCUS7123 [Lemmus lemmus]
MFPFEEFPRRGLSGLQSRWKLLGRGQSFEMGFGCAGLAVLELLLKIRLASNSQTSTDISLPPRKHRNGLKKMQANNMKARRTCVEAI